MGQNDRWLSVKGPPVKHNFGMYLSRCYGINLPQVIRDNKKATSGQFLITQNGFYVKCSKQYHNTNIIFSRAKKHIQIKLDFKKLFATRVKHLFMIIWNNSSVF